MKINFFSYLKRLFKSNNYFFQVPTTPHVWEITENKIKVLCFDDETSKRTLIKIGAKHNYLDSSMYYLNFENKEELAEKLMLLRNAGFPFLSQKKGWSPAAIVKWLCEINLFQGGYKVI